MKLSTLRRFTLLAVVALVIIGLIWNTGTGTLSSMGWRYIASVCPLGAVESFLASRTVFPYALIVLVIIVLLSILLGKFFCSWLCPIPPLRRLFLKKKKPAVDKVEQKPDLDKVELEPGEMQTKSTCKKNCSSCAEKRRKLDSRHIVLGGALLSTVIFGFPVFCLICPVGLVFATIIAFWHWIGFNELTFSLILFPSILILEVFVLRKWCLKFCPLGAFFSLMSLPNRFFRPKVDNSKCLRIQGIECNLCVDYCDEKLDPHFSKGMHECTKCGHCKEHCPAKAITIPFYR